MGFGARPWLGLLLTGGTALAAPSPLEECREASATRVEIGPCLERLLADASAELSGAAEAVRQEMRKLDVATGRPVAVGAFDRSQEAFARHVEANCAWLAAQLGPGTGSGDVERDCTIRMTRARTEELRARVAGAGRVGRPEPPPGPGGPAGLTDRTWRLTRLVRDGKEVALVPGSTPTIQFDQGGRVSGHGSINRFSGGYVVDGAGALRWGQPGFATTLMAGPPELMEQERRFLEALGRASRLRLEGDALVLEDREQTTVLRFGR